MKKIVLFGAGKSATSLIDYLAVQCRLNDWNLLIADINIDTLLQKISGHSSVQAISMGIEDENGRHALIHEADIVISLLPANLHFLIARDCVKYKKNLLTASYVDENIRSMSADISGRHLLFLGEMGLDPGIDHMSAMQIIHRIRAEKGRIQVFRSHTGGLIAPESDDNPWHYKISWNPRNVVRAGSSGAIYKENGVVTEKRYVELFDTSGTVTVAGAGEFAFYPNRDSLAYIPVYGLDETQTFIRTTLRHPAFCDGWKCLVAAGLTDDRLPLPKGIHTVNDWAGPLLSGIPAKKMPLFDFLGLRETIQIPKGAKTAADVLQWVLERKWKMQPADKDMIVMLHEFEYTVNQKKHFLKSSLIVKGEDSVHTAMAKTVGLPLGIAATLVLKGEIHLTGLHIPILPEIYTPVLSGLEKEGIRFEEMVN